jgi:predicted transcriptional regulator
MENSIVSLFQEVGLSRIEASVISCLLEGKEMSARDIERVMDIRQPEVSGGTKGLQARGWIAEKNDNGAGRGRPQKVYTLVMKPENMFNELCKAHEKELKEKEQTLENLKKLLVK